ncbi:hypothetical protein LJB89_00145 [Tyzzerella sp. OttesenSCG-928-J15]|nr:hypothetical protein [Tyzzerella sp. OttesenSCG-928-J15]
MLTSRSNIDHFCVFGNKERIADVLMNLGFVFGNTKSDSLVHVVLEHGYLEYAEGNDGVPESNIVPELGRIVTDKPKLFTLWFGVTDAAKVKANFEAEGFNISGYRIGTEMRRAKHGVNRGYRGRAGCTRMDKEPFTEVVSGFTQHLKNHLMYNQQKFIQVNGARSIDGIVFVCEDEKKVKETNDYFVNADRIINDLSEDATNVRINYYITRDEYKQIFGKEYSGDRSLDMAAVTLAGGDLIYLKERSEELGMNYSIKGRDIYIDATAVLGSFLVFHCDPLFDAIDIR